MFMQWLYTGNIDLMQLKTPKVRKAIWLKGDMDLVELIEDTVDETGLNTDVLHHLYGKAGEDSMLRKYYVELMATLKAKELDNVLSDKDFTQRMLFGLFKWSKANCSHGKKRSVQNFFVDVEVDINKDKKGNSNDLQVVVEKRANRGDLYRHIAECALLSEDKGCCPNDRGEGTREVSIPYLWISANLLHFIQGSLCHILSTPSICFYDWNIHSEFLLYG
ncbi:hypothetical protein B0J14DRAFT_564808 [Halenospora varia]|nr:hypothetical protein B0J14DRAFT_564808 [Halenospora varia]